MTTRRLFACAALALAAAASSPASMQGAGIVSTQLIADDANGADWASNGRTYSEGHYSPLDQVNTNTIGRLKLAWSLDLDVFQRSDAQPLEAGGVVYAVAGLSIVQAVDAVTGKLLWRYDPEVAVRAKQKLRPSWGVRGLALWTNKVIVGTQDGRLIAIDARSGKLVWSTQTLDPNDESTITGAPRVFNGKVVIGYAGAERTRIRGSVGCYDAETGKLLWRFYTVPGDPAKGFENEAMAMAAKTWSGEWWKYGGGGTVWNAMTYDPELNRLYIGTGNGGPWNWRIRNPDGGDALFLASIVALDADTGEYIWHYQENPNEAWDYNATMDIAMATLPIDGRPRKVLMQAPKNGFYYVIDRETGKLISAGKTAQADWAEGYDLNTGRPIEKPGIRYENGPLMLWPGTFGTHNWHAMAFSPKTNIAYLPMIRQADAYSNEGIEPTKWQPTPNTWNSGMGSTSSVHVPVEQFGSYLLAWDPVKQRPLWSAPNPGIVNGGTMATAGGLVFQGLLDGNFVARDALTGNKLWSFFGGVSVLGAPISYSVNGKQYITVMAGPPSGSAASVMPQQSKFGWRYRDHPRRLLTFTLDGRGRLPPTPPPAAEQPNMSTALVPDPQRVALGRTVANTNCRTCHGMNMIASGAAPDLRASAIPLDADAFRAVVKDGALVSQGMPQFSEFSDEEVDAMRHYIRQQALHPVAARPEGGTP